jgi:hypothetical protein
MADHVGNEEGNDSHRVVHNSAVADSLAPARW